MTKNEIHKLIKEAFSVAQQPATTTELTDGGIDGPSVVEHFFGRKQQDIIENFSPSLHMEDFFYMTPNAVAYYLPPLLERMLDEPFDDDLWFRLYRYLRPEKSFSKPVWALESQQLRAISIWAEYLAETWRNNEESFPTLDEIAQAQALTESYAKAV